MALNPASATITRSGEMPRRVRLTIVIDSQQYPQLAKWVWERPYGAADPIRKVLNAALEAGALHDAVPPHGE